MAILQLLALTGAAVLFFDSLSQAICTALFCLVQVGWTGMGQGMQVGMFLSTSRTKNHQRKVVVPTPGHTGYKLELV